MKKWQSLTDVPYLILELQSGDINRFKIDMTKEPIDFEAIMQAKDDGGTTLRDKIIEISEEWDEELALDDDELIQALLVGGGQVVRRRNLIHFPYLFQDKLLILIIEKGDLCRLLRLDGAVAQKFMEHMGEALSDKGLVNSMLAIALDDCGFLGAKEEKPLKLAYHCDDFRDTESLVMSLLGYLDDDMSLQVFKMKNGYDIFVGGDTYDEMDAVDTFFEGLDEIEEVGLREAFCKEHGKEVTNNFRKFFIINKSKEVPIPLSAGLKRIIAKKGNSEEDD